MRDLVLKIGAAIIILGVFGLVVGSGLPDGVLTLMGFSVAIGAVVLGLRLRPDDREDREG